MKKISAITVLVATLSLCGAAIASAVDPPANSPTVGQALEISPPVLTLSANPGETIKTQISIRDVSNDKLIVQGQVNDFTAAGEDGTPKILLDENEANPYSIISWVSPLPSRTLEPKNIVSLPITITVPADAAPGGYYGVIRFTATAPGLDDTGVALSASLGSLVFIRVNGLAKEVVSIEQFTTLIGARETSLFESAPVNFMVRLKNSGTVHEQPAGSITVKDMFGKTVGATYINQPPRNILPSSIRRFEQPFDSSIIGNKFLFGRYTADLKVTYGDPTQAVTKQLVFWVIPLKLIAGIIIGLIVVFFALRTLIRRYNRAIIKRAGGQRPRRR